MHSYIFGSAYNICKYSWRMWLPKYLRIKMLRCSVDAYHPSTIFFFFKTRKESPSVGINHQNLPMLSAPVCQICLRNNNFVSIWTGCWSKNIIWKCEPNPATLKWKPQKHSLKPGRYASWKPIFQISFGDECPNFSKVSGWSFPTFPC